MSGGPGTIRPIAAALILAGLFLGKEALAHECTVTGKQKCDCDLTQLQPLQVGLGMKEVDYKRRHIDDILGKLIKVVVGPNSKLYITDHHHAARALLDTMKPGVCKVVNSDENLDPTGYKDGKAFLKALEDKKLVWLENEHGKAIEDTDLPKTLKEMQDDPYRSLAWLVRMKNGFCKDENAPDFMEFAWADWFRPQYNETVVKNLPSDPNVPNDTVDNAVIRAHSLDAKKQNLPGWSADGKCN
jgi:hypothetical protein